MADDQQREVDEIRKAAMRAAKITTQLLAFSRQQVLQPADLRLNQRGGGDGAGPAADAAGQRQGGDVARAARMPWCGPTGRSWSRC